MRPVILLFVKEPEPGRVKTRVAATTGPERAAEIYRALTAAVCARLPDDAEVIVLFDPPHARAQVEAWLRPLLAGRAEFRPQAAGDLGARLEQAFGDALAAGRRKVAAIGSDCVDLSPALFQEAWDALDSAGCDCVLGPTPDGGYYLVALAEPNAAIFHQIPWSTDATLRRTLERASAAGLQVHLLPEQSDVDSEADWVAVEPRLAIAPPATQPFPRL